MNLLLSSGHCDPGLVVAEKIREILCIGTASFRFTTEDHDTAFSKKHLFNSLPQNIAAEE